MNTGNSVGNFKFTILTIYIILALTSLSPMTVKAQMGRLYTMQQGLPTTHTSISYVDDDGLLWLMGERSMSYFDGNQFHKVLDSRSETALRINLIYSMTQIGKHSYLLGTGFGLYHFDSQTYKFTQISLGEDSNQMNMMPGFPVSSVTLFDNRSKAIVTTSGFGSQVIDVSTLTINKELTSKLRSAIEDNFVYTTYIDTQGTLWASTTTVPLVKVSLRTMKAQNINIDPTLSKKISNGLQIMCMCEDKDTHNILFGVPGLGLLLYDYEVNTVRETRGYSGHVAPRTLIHTKLGDIFIGTDNAGIFEYDRNSETIKPVGWEVPGLDLAVSKVHHLTEDSAGNLVATLYQSGVLIVPSYASKLTFVPVSRTGNGINSSPVSCLLHANGEYWIGTDGSGVFKASDQEFVDMTNVSDGLNLMQMTSIIAAPDGSIWASSYGGGVQMYDGQKWVTPSYVKDLANQPVLSLVPDNKTNRIYVCINGSGLYVVDIKEKKNERIDIPEIGNRFVSCATIDSKRDLWIVYATGLCRYNLDTHKAERVDLTGFGNTQINDMAVIGKKIYFATSNGIAVYSGEGNKVELDKNLNSKLDEVNLKSVLEVDGKLWVTSSQSVSILDISDNSDIKDGKVVETYNSFPGFYIGELNQRSRMIGTKSFICFGGDNGILVVSTKYDDTHDRRLEKLLFTGLSVNGKTIVYDPDNENNILHQSIMTVEEISLSPEQNTFSVSFGSLEFAHADEVEYMYTLQGHDDMWHEAYPSSAEASYSSLSPGSYTLHVKARLNGSEEWIERTLCITIRHPWYSKWWAVGLYFILFAMGAWFVYHMFRERSRQKKKMRRLQHAEQIKEAKLKLFTNIAHELRTPLTMIISPLKQLQTTDTDKKRAPLYDVMHRNCDRLLNIVKQITDMRRIDNGQLRLHFSEFDFIAYCDNIMNSFTGVAQAKNIEMKLFHDEGAINIWADDVHLEKIIINLLSNAFKFTPNGGNILIRTEIKENNDGTFSNKAIGRYLLCNIYNSGSHIDDRDIDHIFERFYQGNAQTAVAGSGIGLNLTYELTKLHHGEITAKNAEPDGVEFVLKLPLGKEHLTAEEMTPREMEMTSQTELISNKKQISTLESAIAVEQNIESQDTEEVKSKKTLLIVDDDKEICDYMRSQLEGDYKIIICFNGNDAWKQVLTVRPDVVITDLMMEDGDGLALCSNIKQNSETAHIPVIMLTAESDEESHLKSMNAQVDGFLTKPFNIDILKGSLSQVLKVRENLLNKAKRSGIQHDYEEMEMESYEEKFFTKVNDVIKRNIDDSSFTVEALSREVGISRVHLNRKLKEHYGVSPNAFIRSVRLKQAAYLLVNNKVNISEVAYKVGFASHSYFSNNFHDYFGMTPTEFVTYYSDEANEEQLKKLLE